jgi:6-phosphogluconolactonase
MNLINHKTKNDLEEKLCIEIKEKLNEAIHQSGTASLLVSGGSTPKELYKKLSKLEIQWEKVTVGLVDDRFVDPQDEKSNERLLKENLLINHAAKAKFLCMIYDTSSKEKNLELANKIYHHFHSGIDVCVLGMGDDGHTASLFPKDPDSQKALGEGYHNLLSNTTADVEPYERISCSRFLLYKSSNLYLMIVGEQKLEVLESAKQNAFPISTFFNTKRTALKVYYSKN